MLSGLVTRYEKSKAANWLTKRARADADSMMEALFAEAVALWEARHFVRVSDEEICCTVPFFDCCDKILESSPRYSRMRILYNAAQPTREMREGLVHPKSAPIPDLSVVFGLITFTIEAKRLALGESLPSKYVREGMRRFIDRKYESSPGRAGFMVGYVVRDAVSDIIDSINDAIVAEPDLSSSDQLESITHPLPRLCRCESTHKSDLTLVHSLVDVKS